MGGGTTVAAPDREAREAALRDNVRRLTDNDDEPPALAAALSAIRRELRGAPEGRAWVVKVGTAAAAAAR